MKCFMASFVVLLLLSLLSAPLGAQSCNLWDEDIGPIILGPNDDGSVGPINLPFPVPVYGQTYTRFWINNNGNVTFTGAFSGYTAFAFPNNQGIVIIAPFFADVDTRPPASGKVHYKATDSYVVITWNNVGYYSNHTDRLNRFQLIITRSGYAGFSYANMEWTTGDASGGSNGFGGSPARAGFDAGNGRDAIVFWEGNTPESLQSLRCRTRWYNLRTGTPAEDIEAPDTFIVEGPEQNALVCREPIRFRWTGVDDTTPTEQLVYRWRLDEGDWSDWSAETNVELSSLSDGEHTFEVQARDLANREDPSPASRTFLFRNDPNPPQISNLQAEVQDNRATIRWQTDEPATSQVEYRLQGAAEWERSSENTNLVTEHTVTLTNLRLHGVYEYRAISRDECGNERVSEIGTFLVPAPDLTVTVVQVPQEIWNDTPFDITWRVENAGTRRAANWNDAVYFSRDDRLDGSDYFVGSFPFAGSLEPGQAITRTQTISIPRARISPEGTYYLIVFTDANNAINEGDREDNNRLARALSARLVPLPDLVVPQVQAPATAYFGQSIEVRWQIRNIGQGSTQTPWSDHLLLASDAEGTNVITSWSYPNESALGANEGYTAIRSVTMPRGLVGRYYLVVVADGGNSLSEEREDNNRAAIPIDLLVPPLPDLVVPQVVAPAQSYAGQQVAVRWRVENRGTRDIPAGERTWQDWLYLSRDTQLDTSDRLVGTRTHAGNLQPGEGYTVANYPVTIPRNLPAGEYYLLVLTDATNRVYEFVGEVNNLGVSAQPIQVLATPPNTIDLVVTQLQAPTSGRAGEVLTLTWQVTNEGADPAPAGWVDAVYLSSSPTLDRQQAIRLGATTYPHSLPSGETYERTLEVRLPDCLPAGQYYLFVYTDDTNTVVEYDPGHDAEANNTSQPQPITTQFWRVDLIVSAVSAPSQAVSGTSIQVSWTVQNQGDRPTPVSNWSDRVELVRADGGFVSVLGSFPRTQPLAAGASYTRQAQVTLPPNLQGDFRIQVTTDGSNQVVECDGETNNTAAVPIQLTYGNLPNLLPTNLTLSANTVQVGQPLTVRWRVSNSGQAGAAGWTDGVYIGPNPSLSGARLLARLPAPQPLQAGQSYQQEAVVTIPLLASGNYYVLVAADDTERVFEGDRENDNLVFVYPLQVALPAVNLSVEGVDAPSEATAGFPAQFVWLVRNQGPDPTYATWSDVVILSRDLLLDPTDPVIGVYRHPSPLAGGESRTVQATFTVPAHLSGPYYVFVVSDRNNELLETDESDNRGVDTQAMVITLAPPADLVVANVEVPSSGSPGVPALIRWTVRNQGSNTARGGWYDSVYLSSDAQWDIHDLLIGRVERSADLAPGQEYIAQLQEPLPGVLPGTYRVIVRADARNTVRETDETNNVGVSSAMALDVIELQLGTPFDNALTPTARSHYYKVNVPSGQTLLWSVDVQDDTAETELFVRYGEIALRSAYDFRNERPFGSDQEAVVPRSQAGYYYGLVYGAEVPVSSSYRTVVQALPFGIREVSPHIVGNAGFASLRIQGAQFDDVDRVFVVLSDGQRLNALRVAVVSPSEVQALFSMVGVPPGTYSVGVRTSTGAEAVAENALQVVEEPSEPPLLVRVSGPDTVRPGAQATYYITVYNGGRNDAMGVMLFIRIPTGTPWHIPTLAPPEEGEQALGALEHYDSPNGRVIALLVAQVPAGGSTVVPLILEAPQGGILRVEAFVLGQLPALSTTGLFSIPADACWAQVINAMLSCASAILSTAGIPLPGECMFTVAKGFYDKIVSVVSFARSRTGRDLFNLIFKYVKSWVELLGACGGEALGRAVPILGSVLNWIDCGLSISDAVDACRKKDEKETPVQRPIDPNEKLAPDGYGNERFVPAREPIPYTILFENLPTAGAHARQVVITDQLDSDLDWRTFELDTISFRYGRYTVQVPPGLRFYQTTVQMREEDGGLLVQIIAGIDLSTGVATWRLTALDPNTGEPPTSPLLGILPPNNEQHEGEGYVTFRVRPKRNSPTGTLVTNSAVIVFDEEAPLATNEVFNTLDAVVPTSTVEPLPSVLRQPEFLVRWSGSDDPEGSGLKSYTVWYSVDGSPFRIWLNDTQSTAATFVGDYGRRYAFYVSAMDNAGNLEPAPGAPEALTLVVPPGDVDLNGCVDDADLLAILFAYGAQGSGLPEDVNGDGTVNNEDLTIVLSNLGRGC